MASTTCAKPAKWLAKPTKWLASHFAGRGRVIPPKLTPPPDTSHLARAQAILASQKCRSRQSDALDIELAPRFVGDSGCSPSRRTLPIHACGFCIVYPLPPFSRTVPVPPLLRSQSRPQDPASQHAAAFLLVSSHSSPGFAFTFLTPPPRAVGYPSSPPTAALLHWALAVATPAYCGDRSLNRAGSYTCPSPRLVLSRRPAEDEDELRRGAAEGSGGGDGPCEQRAEEAERQTDGCARALSSALPPPAGVWRSFEGEVKRMVAPILGCACLVIWPETSAITTRLMGLCPSTRRHGYTLPCSSLIDHFSTYSYSPQLPSSCSGLALDVSLPRHVPRTRMSRYFRIHLAAVREWRGEQNDWVLNLLLATSSAPPALVPSYCGVGCTRADAAPAYGNGSERGFSASPPRKTPLRIRTDDSSIHPLLSMSLPVLMLRSRRSLSRGETPNDAGSGGNGGGKSVGDGVDDRLVGSGNGVEPPLRVGMKLSIICPRSSVYHLNEATTPVSSLQPDMLIARFGERKTSKQGGDAPPLKRTQGED
ncbi:hypothetical protein DFH08DRAFT_808311 [Mycena albidolilacea]|uniref:Uncharacterized protein n=1 Tax=Mycena albidolilacea TaxID=1033008 RepID=A0AAD7ESH8_9AGAR|nr:hypothetical protein DFH08DRAFT_808311 [Mycena albidolilacea]